MIVSREIYDAVAKGEPYVVRRLSKLKHVDAPITIRNEHTGEIQERETFTARRSSCPYPVDRTATLRYREYPKGWKKGDPLPAAEGKGIEIIVTETQQQEDGRWLIRWMRVGPHRPMPVTGSNKYLAPARGYTTSTTDSIDPEAPAMPSAEIDAMVADDLAAKREARERALKKFESAATELTEALDTAADGKAVRKIDRMAAELRDLLAEDAA